MSETKRIPISHDEKTLLQVFAVLVAEYLRTGDESRLEQFRRDYRELHDFDGYV